MTKLIEIGGLWVRPDRIDAITKYDSDGAYEIYIETSGGKTLSIDYINDPVTAHNKLKEYASLINEADHA